MCFRFSILFIVCSLSLCAQKKGNYKFQHGESLTYGVYYHLMGIWVSAGDVTFTVSEDSLMNKPCFHFKGVGTTHPRYDWFYKVRDTYEAFAQIEDLTPIRFKRDVQEGSFFLKEDNIYNHKTNEIYAIMQVEDEPLTMDTLPYQPGSLDVLSMIYQARSLDFESYTIGEKIPVSMVIDKETYDLYIRYLGTDVYEHSEIGEIECYLFSALLVDGSIFKGGERMKVWVTKDPNVVPVYIQSEIKVGSIRSELKAYSGLKSGKIESIISN